MREQLQNSIQRKRRSEPMKSYLWFMELPMMDWFDGDVFDISSRILSVSTPYNNFETEKSMYGNSYWYRATSVDIGEITLEVMEMADGNTFDYFSSWMSLISNDNGTFNPPNEYKKDLNFYRLDGLKRKVIRDRYKKYFVSSINEVSNDYEANDVVRYTIVLTGDSVEHENYGLVKSGGNVSLDTKLTTGSSVENLFKQTINKAKTTMSSVYKFLD